MRYPVLLCECDSCGKTEQFRYERWEWVFDHPILQNHTDEVTRGKYIEIGRRETLHVICEECYMRVAPAFMRPK